MFTRVILFFGLRKNDETEATTIQIDKTQLINNHY